MKIDQINKNSYQKKSNLLYFATNKEILIPEQAILEKYKHRIQNKKILDIGFGGGRTTEHLRKISLDYIGIDYCQEMVDLCKKQYPELTFVCCDVRDMSIFNDNEFDFIFFSYNGLDSLENQDRIEGLKEIHKKLKPNALFVFSSHNLNYEGLPYHPKIFTTLNPKQIVRNLIRKLNHLRHRKFEVYGQDYAILSDPALGYGVLLYHIQKETQIKMLEDVGFRDIELVDEKGNFIKKDTLDSKNPYLHYVAWKK